MYYNQCCQLDCLFRVSKKNQASILNWKLQDNMNMDHCRLDMYVSWNNLGNFVLLIFYVKSILANLKSQNLSFLTVLGSLNYIWFCQIQALQITQILENQYSEP